MTVCTNSRAQKKLIAQYLHETADSLEGLPFKLHDFGFRGSTSVEVSTQSHRILIGVVIFEINNNYKYYNSSLHEVGRRQQLLSQAV